MKNNFVATEVSLNTSRSNGQKVMARSREFAEETTREKAQRAKIEEEKQRELLEKMRMTKGVYKKCECGITFNSELAEKCPVCSRKSGGQN